MLRKLSISAFVVTLAAGIGFASQSNAQSAAPASKINPVDGKQMFATLCSSCHGADARGHGPAVIEYKAPPIDLTVLSKNNHGKFPEAHVVHVLEYGAAVPSHTAVQMPVWGPVLGKINPRDPKEKEVRISSLSHYLETIQVK
jgi:mono/diheme cytochrome c family protein